MKFFVTTIRVFLIALIATTAGLQVAAQVQDQVKETKGTMGLVEGRRYMVAFPQVWASPSEKPTPTPMLLYISSKVKATVTVSTPSEINSAVRIQRTITLKPNEVYKLSIPISLMSEQSEMRTGYGIQVVGDKPISVYTYQAWNGNGELARHLPVEAWGKNYYTMNFYQDKYATGYEKMRPSQILVIAAYDNTIVNYTPTWDTEGGMETPSVPANSSQQIVLNRGDTYLIKARVVPELTKEFKSDLSGTWIRATRPVGVISGHTKVAIMRYPDVLPPTGMYATEAHFVRNNVHDAMLPFEMAGTKFVTIPCMYTSTRVTGKAASDIGIDDDRGDVIRVIALEDGTTISAMRQDGSGLMKKWLINRGETRLETALEVATYWESDKPILMGQYGKSYAKVLPPAIQQKGDATQGHPTVESGMPMLQYIPSVDRWANYGVFSSPEGMDNFFNIVFKTSDLGNIKVDGRALASAFGGAMRPLQGTEYSYIRTPIAVGDHVVESVSDDVKWAAWTYGSLDGLEQGRAYGTPITVDLAIACDDSLAVTEKLLCGDVDGVGKILPEGITCGSIFAVYADNLVNYEFIEDPGFSSGDKEVKFTLKVIDKTKDASGTVRVVSRSGKYVEKTYTYVSDKFDFSPKKIDFGTIPFNTPACKDVTIRNLRLDAPLTVVDLRTKYFPGVYSISPKSFVIPPGGEQVVNICATITDTREKLDTLLVKLECYEAPATELRVRGDEPTIFVTDQTWVNVPSSHPGIPKEVEIINGGKVDLIITGYDEALVASQNHFFNFETKQGAPLKSVFPLTLTTGQRYAFNVTYSPQGDAVSQHTLDVPFFSNALVVDSIAVLKGNGVTTDIYATATPWNVRVLDNVQSNQGITQYTQEVSFSNAGSQAVTFDQPYIEGPDAASFKIVDNGNTGGFPIQLIGSNQNQKERYITIAFVPTEQANRGAERNNYAATLVFPNSSSNSKYEVALNGIAWQPHVKGADHDYGSFQAGDPVATATITLVNENYQDVTNPTSGDTKGTHAVTITGIRLLDPAAGFVVDYGPTPATPFILQPGETRDITVSFNPAMAGTFTTTYEVLTQPSDMTDGAAPYTPSYKLTAVVAGGDFTVQGSNAEQYVFNAKEMTITIRHTEATTRRFNIATPSGLDGSRFTVAEQYIDVPPGVTGTVHVTFIPDYITKLRNGQDPSYLQSPKAQSQGLKLRGNAFSTDVEITDAVNGKKQVATLTGDGLFLETTNFVGTTYQVSVAKSIDIPIELKAVPEALDVANLTELRIRISYDANIVRPRLNAIITDGTQLQGGRVITATQVLPNMIELDIETAQPITSAGGPLFKLTFDSYLGKSADPANPFISPINIYTYPVDFNNSDGVGKSDQYVLFHDEPGKLEVLQDCAKNLRLVQLSSARFSIKPIAPNPVSGSAVINYSIGLPGATRIALYNASGVHVMDLVNENLAAGEYELTLDVTALPAGTYFYRVISGPYISDDQVLTVVR